MAASKGTIQTVADILVEEVGMTKARGIAFRLVTETRGNQSYEMTVKSLEACLEQMRSVYMRNLGKAGQ